MKCTFLLKKDDSDLTTALGMLYTTARQVLILKKDDGGVISGQWCQFSKKSDVQVNNSKIRHYYFVDNNDLCVFLLLMLHISTLF